MGKLKLDEFGSPEWLVQQIMAVPLQEWVGGLNAEKPWIFL